MIDQVDNNLENQSEPPSNPEDKILKKIKFLGKEFSKNQLLKWGGAALGVAALGALTYATFNGGISEFLDNYLKNMPMEQRLLFEDKSLLCSNDYYESSYLKFIGNKVEVTEDMIKEKEATVSSEIEMLNQSLTYELSKDTNKLSASEIETREYYINSINNQIEQLNKKLVRVQQGEPSEFSGTGQINKFLEDIDDDEFLTQISIAIGGKHRRNSLISLSDESQLKFQSALAWENLDSETRQNIFNNTNNSRPIYSYYGSCKTSSSNEFCVEYGFTGQPIYNYTNDQQVILNSEKAKISVELPGDYLPSTNPIYKAKDTLSGMQCLEYIDIPDQANGNISFVKELPELLYLNINESIDTGPLRYAKKLKALNLAQSTDMSFLDHDTDQTLNTHVTNLTWFKTNISNITSLEHLQYRENLKYLILNINNGLYVGTGADSGEIENLESNIQATLENNSVLEKQLSNIVTKLDWPNLEYLEINGPISTDFGWLHQFPSLKELILSVTYESINTSKGYKDCNDPPNYYKYFNPYIDEIIDPPYTLSSLYPFKDSNLKKLTIDARSTRLCDCEILENTLKNVAVDCTANQKEACPFPGEGAEMLLEGDADPHEIIFSYTERKVTQFEKDAWKKYREEVLRTKKNNMTQDETARFYEMLFMAQDAYMSGYNFVVTITAGGIMKGEYELWGPAYIEGQYYAIYHDNEDKMSDLPVCTDLSGEASMWLSWKPAIGECSYDKSFDNFIEEVYEQSNTILNIVSAAPNYLDNYSIQGNIVRHKNGQQVDYYEKINLAGNEVFFLVGNSDSLEGDYDPPQDKEDKGDKEGENDGYHWACDAENMCVKIIDEDGENFEDQCSDDSDCYHWVCSGVNCIQVGGAGEDQCSSNIDCGENQTKLVKIVNWANRVVSGQANPSHSMRSVLSQVMAPCCVDDPSTETNDCDCGIACHDNFVNGCKDGPEL